MAHERKRIYTRRTTDPRFLLKRNLRVMSLALDQLAEKSKRRIREKCPKCGVSTEDYQARDIANMCHLGQTLARLAQIADDDDAVIKKQLEGLSDAELEAALKKRHSDAIKEGLDLGHLERDIHIPTKDQKA